MSKKIKTTPETIEVRETESFTTYIAKESITINVADYPELEGKDEEEIKDYIRDNAYEMKSPYDWADSLADALNQMDSIKEKITNEDSEYLFG